ncbi:3-dehydrosphinganine reductase [Paragonimus westermani]|uniref:3-dehydrosphinganine reductase n=1 Tax=Paragonimus westermani TaxID=34504 RepID=A0A5J4ND40_9TREM|nr:3-dehydrosphinganine reductase [Paragonimus westermani]
MEVVDRFAYLRSCVSGGGGGVGNEIEARISKAKVMFANLGHLILKGRVYQTTVRAILLYGSEAWPLRMEDVTHLQVSDHPRQRSIAPVEWLLTDFAFKTGCDSMNVLFYSPLSGPVDVLVNCAGYAVSRTFVDTPPEAIECMIRTNYLSAVHVTKILLPDMLCDKTRPSCDRRIAFVCSMAGQIGVYGLAAYSGSKYALRGFAEVLRMELEPSGPLVTLAFPPDTDTPGLATENVGKPDVTREISAAGGLAKPEQVASSLFKAILTGVFVCSYGVEGTALSWATAGLLPPLGIGNKGEQTTLGLVVSAVIEVLVAGPLRAFGIGYALWMRHILHKHERSKQAT